MTSTLVLNESRSAPSGLKTYYDSRIEDLTQQVAEKTQTIRRLEAQRNELNSKGTFHYEISHHFVIVRDLRDELQYLLEPASYVGEVVKSMGKSKVLVKVRDYLDWD